jgi:hypothetical protein
MNNPSSQIDFLGMWNEDVHKELTASWGVEVGVRKWAADIVGIADNQVDTDYDPKTITESNWSWHFNRSNTGIDSREQHFLDNLEKAKEYCDFATKQNDDPINAAKALGTALHPKQDIVAHGDYNRKSEVPDLSAPASRGLVGSILHNLPYWHNWAAPSGGSRLMPDDWTKDADTPNGMPTFSGKGYTKLVDGVNVVIGHKYINGSIRYDATRDATWGAYDELRAFIKKDGGKAPPHCKCREAFGVK